MEAVKHDCIKALYELEETLLYLKEYMVSADTKTEDYVWFAIFPDWAYSPVLQKLAPTQRLQNHTIFNINYFFAPNLMQSRIQQLQYRISSLNSLYHYISRCNPTLDKENITNLIVASLEQSCNEHTR